MIDYDNEIAILLQDTLKSPRSGRFMDLETRDPNKEAECEYAAVRSPGCIVIPRILCRAKGFKVR